MEFKFFRYGLEEVVNCKYENEFYLLRISKRMVGLRGKLYNRSVRLQTKIRSGPGPNLYPAVREELNCNTKRAYIKLIPNKFLRKLFDTSKLSKSEKRRLRSKFRLINIPEKNLFPVGPDTNYSEEELKKFLRR
ncbi:MAG: hypothetical protein AABX88_00705 [Nanoarchaeota archaeon]